MSNYEALALSSEKLIFGTLNKLKEENKVHNDLQLDARSYLRLETIIENMKTEKEDDKAIMWTISAFLCGYDSKREVK